MRLYDEKDGQFIGSEVALHPVINAVQRAFAILIASGVAPAEAVYFIMEEAQTARMEFTLAQRGKT